MAPSTARTLSAVPDLKLHLIFVVNTPAPQFDANPLVFRIHLDDLPKLQEELDHVSNWTRTGREPGGTRKSRQVSDANPLGQGRVDREPIPH